MAFNVVIADQCITSKTRSHKLREKEPHFFVREYGLGGEFQTRRDFETCTYDGCVRKARFGGGRGSGKQDPIG